MHRLTVLDLFSGCGGLSTGFQQAGLRVIAASDNDKAAAMTYRRNHRGVRFIEGDITDGKVRARIVAAAKRVDVVAGGIPCQAFSANGRRDPKDLRGWLWWEFLAVVRSLRPKWCVIENVERIRDIMVGGQKLMVILEGELSGLGYRMESQLLNAVDFGVAQNRKRVIILAARDGVAMPDFPGPSTSKPLTVEQAIGDLTDVKDNPALSHVRMSHTADIVARFGRTRRGSEASVSGHHSGFWRCIPDRPARTVTTSRSQFVHWLRPRCLTVREMARLQGFTDDFRFDESMSMSAQLRQVGNAVPPPLARAVALKIVEASQKATAVAFLGKEDKGKLTERQRAAVAVRRHLAREADWRRQAEPFMVKATIEAYAIGRIIWERIQGGKRGKYGEGQLSKFCTVADIGMSSSKNYRAVYLAAGSIAAIRRWRLPTKYWVELDQFNTGDAFGSIMGRELRDNPIIDPGDPDGGADAQRMRQVRAAFKSVHSRLTADHHPFLSAPTRSPFVPSPEWLRLVPESASPYKSDYDASIINAQNLKLSPDEFKACHESWMEAVEDLEHTISVIAGRDRYLPWQVYHPPWYPPEWPDIDWPLCDPSVPYTHRGKWDETERDPLKDRLAARTRAEWERLSRSLTAADRRELSRLVRIDQCEFQDFEPGKVSAIITDVPYDLPWLSENMAALAKFCREHLRAGAPAAVMAGSVSLDVALAELVKGGLTYRWLVNYRLPSGAGFREDMWPKVLQHRTKPVLVMHLAKKPLPARRITDEIPASGPDDKEAWAEFQGVKAMFPHAQDVPGWMKLVDMLVPARGVVCDPCLGSGTTAICCLRSGRRFVGCDCDKVAFTLAKLRIEAEWAVMKQEAKRKTAQASAKSDGKAPSRKA